MEAERRAALARQRVPVLPRRLEQGRGADDVGLDERAGAVDRAVDMGLGRDVDDRIWLVRADERRHGARVGDVGLLEPVARRLGDVFQRREVGGVGQRIDIDDRRVAVAVGVADEGGADEPGAAGDEHLHRAASAKAAKVGHLRSRSDSTACEGATGQAMARPGSFHRMPPSWSGA